MTWSLTQCDWLKTLTRMPAARRCDSSSTAVPSPRGRSMRDKTEWMSRHADDVRRMLMLEPRGHRDMHGAMLTEPVSPGRTPA